MSTSPQSHSANTAVPSARLIPIILRLAGLFVLILALLFAWLHWWWGLALLILLFIGCLLLFSWLLVRFSLDTTFQWNMIRYSDYTSERHFLPFIQAQSWFSQHATEIGITTCHNRYASARWIPQPQSNNRHLYAVIVHGYGNAAFDAMCVAARGFYRMDFNILCPSLQGHGTSEGRFITMGVQESDDVMDWVSWILHHDPQAQIYLYGVSMGASTVMMCANQANPHIAGIIEDCGYSNAAAQFIYQLRKIFGLPPFPFIPLASRFCKAMTGVSFQEMDVRPALRTARIPVLMIHGQRDGFVPFEMLEENYACCRSWKQQLVQKEARHGESIYKDPGLYWQTIEQFIQQTQSPSAESKETS